jgi:2',3'-cyclic-nucleotide 2'-phosphodiesterase (5'-nucleotidase family)
MTKSGEETAIFFPPPRIIPLFWEHDQLLPEQPPTVSPPQASEITILHTNDLHSSVDGRQDTDGKTRGGLARIATTIRRARAAGPALVFDTGDFVYGGGTWWDIQGAGAVAHLRGRAGCDLATIGNHDLEHGIAGLRELLIGGYPFVSANLQVEDHQVQQHLRPAYIIEIAGWGIGVTGLTTLSTFDLIPSRILQGITLAEPEPALVRVVAALEPQVDTIIVLSHLGFYESGTGDPGLARLVAGSKVSVILGAHTHDALDPARIVAGITICNAGAYGANVGEVKLRRGSQDIVEVQTRLIPQDETIPDDPLWLDTRTQVALSFQALHEAIIPLPVLPQPTGSALNRDREWTLLARALRESGIASFSSLLMVPFFYVLGPLPEGERATLAEIMTVYPNIEYLVEAEINGKVLKELIALQSSLLYYQQARPTRLSDETEMHLEQVDENNNYSIVTSELIRQGGLGWGLTLTDIISSRSLDVTCLQVVRDYLAS